MVPDGVGVGQGVPLEAFRVSTQPAMTCAVIPDTAIESVSTQLGRAQSKFGSSWGSNELAVVQRALVLQDAPPPLAVVFDDDVSYTS